MERTVGLTSEKNFPEFSNQTFKDWFKTKKSRGKKKIAYFVGCSTNYYNPDVGKSVLEVLEKNNHEVILPDQTCCGVARLNYGDLDLARKNMEYNINSLLEVVKQGYEIVTSCPSCSLSLKEEYIDITDRQEARLIAENTYNINEYLLKLHDAGQLNLELNDEQKKYAHHTPCHLKAQMLGNSTKKLLELLPGVKVEEVDAGCCGSAGTFGFKDENYELSMKIGENVFNELKNMSFDQVLTDCDACRMQLAEGTGKQIIHPIQVIANRY